MSCSRPRLATALHSKPDSPRNDSNFAVSSSLYGATSTMRRAPRCDSASTRAPLVVVARGAPDDFIASTRSLSPATPRMKLHDVQAYAYAGESVGTRLAVAAATMDVALISSIIASVAGR